MKKAAKYTALSLLALVLLVGITLQYSRSWERGLFLKPLYRLDSDSKVIALTFDDGPSAERTPALLDMLDSLNAKATFFMLGENIAKHPGIAQDVLRRGHLIGNHSFDHPRLIFKGPAFVRDQIERTNSLIRAAGQAEVRYFRPPYSSKYVVLPLVLRKMGKVLVTGTYDPPAEYRQPYNAEDVAEQVIANAEPGTIVYLHDGRSTDVEEFVRSVELIVTGLRKNGYKFVRLDMKE